MQLNPIPDEEKKARTTPGIQVAPLLRRRTYAVQRVPALLHMSAGFLFSDLLPRVYAQDIMCRKVCRNSPPGGMAPTTDVEPVHNATLAAFCLLGAEEMRRPHAVSTSRHETRMTGTGSH